MSDRHPLPETIRALFQRPTPPQTPAEALFTEPRLQTMEAGRAESQPRMSTLEPVVRFTIEQQLEALHAILDEIDSVRPELFRHTEQGRDLLDLTQILLNRDPVN
jgi:hypothetical protein